MTINNLKSLFRTNNNAIICKEKLYTQTYELSATESHMLFDKALFKQKMLTFSSLWSTVYWSTFVVYSRLIDFCGLQYMVILLWSTVHASTFVVYSTLIYCCGLQSIDWLLWSTVHWSTFVVYGIWNDLCGLQFIDRLL